MVVVVVVPAVVGEDDNSNVFIILDSLESTFTCNLVYLRGKEPAQGIAPN